jgi:hypothetical protein
MIKLNPSTFLTINYPGKNVLIACLKLKGMVNVLGPKLSSNAVWTILEGFLKASTAPFTQMCATKFAMHSDSPYASFKETRSHLTSRSLQC